MDLSLRDALGGGGVPGGAPADSLLKRDFMASLEKESYDDKVGETMSKSDYRPLVDGKDLSKSGPGMMSSMMSSGGYHDKPGPPTFSSDPFSGFSQSPLGGTMGSGLPPFQTTMASNPFGPAGMVSSVDSQKSSGLFGVDNKTSTGTSEISPFKSSGLGIQPTDYSAAPVLSPSGSNDDVSPASSGSEDGPNTAGGEARRRKKRRKSHDEAYDFLDGQEKTVAQEGMGQRGVEENEEEEDEEENWEWDIKESGGGGRVRGKKNKTRARLPEEWGAPQQPVSPTPATIAPTWPTGTPAGVSDLKAPNYSPVQTSACAEMPPSFTNHTHSGLAADLPTRTYEPMCVDSFPDTKAQEGPLSKPGDSISVAAGAGTAKSGPAADVGASLALMTGDNLSPVSQTFSFLDSVLQTPQASTPDSQTTTPITNTPSLATAPLTKTSPKEPTIPALEALSATKTTPLLTPAFPSSTITAASGSALNVDAAPFVPAANKASPLSSAPPCKSEAPPTSSSISITPSVTKTDPFSLPAHSEHPESSSPQRPPLEVISPQTTAVKADNKEKAEKPEVTSAKTEKIDTFDPKDKEQQKKDISPNQNQTSDKILKDQEKTEKMNAEKNKANEKMAEKTDKPEKTDKDEKKEEEKKEEKKTTSTVNVNKTLPSPDSKSKNQQPDTSPVKPNKPTKSRPSNLSTNNEANANKHPSPTAAAANKKSPAPKQTTPSATKRSPVGSAKTPENGVAEKRSPVPKASSTPHATANKNGLSAAAAKPAATKNDKTETKAGDTKKPKTAARPRPASSATPATPAASTNGDAHRRRVITKPPVPKQMPLEKKPPVPRTNRTPRPINAPTPDLKNVRSKIGSIDNIKYQPGGGGKGGLSPQVPSTPNNKTPDSCAPNAKSRVQIVHKKLDFSHITSRCGSKDNIKHVPGGGKVQILNKKMDVSKVTAKCGSKDNMKHKPGGGDVKIESHKVNVKAKAKIGSMDNIGVGNTNGHKEEKAEDKTPSPAGGAPAPAGVSKENGLKESTPPPLGGDTQKLSISQIN